jgi:hypothetical protein
MNGWLGFELRWLRLLLDATIPDLPERAGLATVDLGTFWPELAAAAPPLLRFGLRASAWIFTWLPLVLPGYFRPFFALTPERRDAFLSQMGRTNVFVLRQLAATLKIIGSFALFRDPASRRALGVVP